MTITEANHVARLLRFAAGQHAGTDDQIRETFTELSQRAAKPLQVTITIDSHDIDAAIVRHREVTGWLSRHNLADLANRLHRQEPLALVPTRKER